MTFSIDTGDTGGSKGPWLNWTSNGSAQKGFAPKTWYMREGSGADVKETTVPAFETGCVMDLDTLQLGWMKDGGQGQAPIKQWNPSISQATQRPDESKRPGTDKYAWTPALSVRCAIGNGQAATWEQSAFGAYDAFSKLSKQISAEWGEKSQNGKLLPLIKQTGVIAQQMNGGGTNKPVLEVVQWVERPDCLKDDAPTIATAEPVEQTQAAVEAATANAANAAGSTPADATF